MLKRLTSWIPLKQGLICSSGTTSIYRAKRFPSSRNAWRCLCGLSCSTASLCGITMPVIQIWFSSSMTSFNWWKLRTHWLVSKEESPWCSCNLIRRDTLLSIIVFSKKAQKVLSLCAIYWMNSTTYAYPRWSWNLFQLFLLTKVQTLLSSSRQLFIKRYLCRTLYLSHGPKTLKSTFSPATPQSFLKT